MTRRFGLLLTVAVAMLLACAGAVLAQATAPPQRAAGDVVPGRYIVVLRDDIVQASSAQVASEQARRHGLEVIQTYRNALNGYAARIPAGRLDDVLADNRVRYVEPDRVVRAVGQKLPRGINRIGADENSTKAGDGLGSVSNVNAYVIDTGIDRNHRDLDVVDHVNFHGGTNTDCDGHGTHVAGTVAARDDDTNDVVGVAPGAPLTGVKVLGCNGSGYLSNVIKGVEWVTVNAQKPAIANMSLGGGVSNALDTAVKNSADSGVFYSIAAGNSGRNACNYSPARAGKHDGVMTTAATDNRDRETSWSNYGDCVDIWAPGAKILSTKLGGGKTTFSGTSMAAPHVGGTGALYLSTNTGSSAAGVESQLKVDVADGVTKKSKDGRVIELIYAGNY